MAEFKKCKNSNTKCTIISVSGLIRVTDVEYALDKYYTEDITKCVIWDFTEANFATFTQSEIMAIIKLAKSFAEKRDDGKTALISDKPAIYGLLRKYEINCEIDNHSIHHEVFKTLDAAIKWINSED